MKNLKIVASLIGLLVSFSFVNVSAMEKNVENLNQQKRELTQEEIRAKAMEQFKVKETKDGKEVYTGNGVFTDGLNKCIYFEFFNRKKKGDEYTKLAEKVLRENKDKYERMVKLTRYTYPSGANFDLKYVRTLLNEYIEALEQKEYGVDYGGNEDYNNHIHNLFRELCDVFRRGYYSTLILNDIGEIGVDKETKMFGYSVVFKLNDIGMVKGARLFDVNKHFAAQNLLDRILEFFVVFLDFYKKANGDQESTEKLDKEVRPKLNVEGEYGLLYNNNSKEFAPQDEEIKDYIEDKVVYANLNGRRVYEKYKCVKFNGEFEDLFRFYKMIYEEIANNENLKRKYHIFDEIYNDEYFKLFNPENIKDIVTFNVNNSILFMFKKNKLDESQSKLLKHFRSIYKGAIGYLNSRLSVSAIKQIIKIYFNFVDIKGVNLSELNLKNELYKKENIKWFEEEDEYAVRTMNLSSVALDWRFKAIGDKIRPVIKDIEVEGVEFNGKPEDLLKFYKKAYNILREKQVFPRARWDDYILFDPENVKYIAVEKNGLNAVFKFDITNIRKYINEGGYDSILEKRFFFKEQGYNKVLKKLFFDLFRFVGPPVGSENFIYIQHIILTYLERVEKKKEEMKRLELEKKKEEETIEQKRIKYYDNYFNKEKDKKDKKEEMKELELEKKKEEDKKEYEKEENVNKEELNKEDEKEENKKEDLKEEEENEKENVDKEDEKNKEK